MVAWASTGGIGIADGPLRGKGIRQGLESGLEGPKRPQIPWGPLLFLSKVLQRIVMCCCAAHVSG